MKLKTPVAILLAAALFTGGGTAAFAQATPLPPEVASVQADLQSSCALASPGVLIDQAGCLAAISRSLVAARGLAAGLQAEIGVLIGDIAESVPALQATILALVADASLPALSAGVQVGLASVGPTDPRSASPA